MGQFVQSHGMHFFHLAAPDLVLGFDADPATRNVFGIIKAESRARPEGGQPAALRPAESSSASAASGSIRTSPCPVGVNAPLAAQPTATAIAAEHETMVGIALEAISIGKGWLEANKDLAESFASFPSNYMGLVDKEGGPAALRRRNSRQGCPREIPRPVQTGPLPLDTWASTWSPGPS